MAELPDDSTPPEPIAQPVAAAPPDRVMLRRKVLGWGATAAVASALLALAANLSEIFGALKPDDTRELVEQTRGSLRNGRRYR